MPVPQPLVALAVQAAHVPATDGCGGFCPCLGALCATGYGAGIAFEPHAAGTNMALLPKLGFQKLDAVQPCPTALSLALD